MVLALSKYASFNRWQVRSLPTLVDSFKPRGGNAIVRLQMEPHLVAHAHNKVGNAGPSESARKRDIKPLFESPNISTFT